MWKTMQTKNIHILIINIENKHFGFKLLRVMMFYSKSVAKELKSIKFYFVQGRRI